MMEYLDELFHKFCQYPQVDEIWLDRFVLAQQVVDHFILVYGIHSSLHQ